MQIITTIEVSELFNRHLELAIKKIFGEITAAEEKELLDIRFKLDQWETKRADSKY